MQGRFCFVGNVPHSDAESILANAISRVNLALFTLRGAMVFDRHVASAGVRRQGETHCTAAARRRGSHSGFSAMMPESGAKNLMAAVFLTVTLQISAASEAGLTVT